MVAGEDQHVLARLAAHRVKILVNSVRRTLVPLLAHTLHGRQDLDKLPQFGAHDAPSLAQMTVKRERFVLGDHENAAQVRVHAVRKSDIDNAIDAAERHGWLGAITRERKKTLARPSR